MSSYALARNHHLSIRNRAVDHRWGKNGRKHAVDISDCSRWAREDWIFDFMRRRERESHKQYLQPVFAFIYYISAEKRS